MVNYLSKSDNCLIILCLYDRLYVRDNPTGGLGVVINLK